MKQMLIFAFATVLSCTCARAAEDTVKVSAAVEADVLNSRVKNECASKAKKLAIQKYCRGLDDKMGESIVDAAVASYKDFVDEVEADEGDYEDGEFSCSYSITVKREELMQFLTKEGWKPLKVGTAKNISIVIAENPPSKKIVKRLNDSWTRFGGADDPFEDYSELQKRIVGSLVKQVGALGIEVPLLSENARYASLRKNDPNVVGVFYDPEAGDAGEFKNTRNFLDFIKDNNPDSVVLYYHIGNIALDPANGSLTVNVALSLKNLKTDTTAEIGNVDGAAPPITTKDPATFLGVLATTVDRTMCKLLNGEDANSRIMTMIEKLRADESASKGPLTVVFNFSGIDKKIRTRSLGNLKKALVAAGICEEGDVERQNNTLKVKEVRKNGNDRDELWLEIIDVLEKIGIEVDDDSIMTVNGNTMTVVPGRESEDE